MDTLEELITFLTPKSELFLKSIAVQNILGKNKVKMSFLRLNNMILM
jgi:hypothetical protein